MRHAHPTFHRYPRFGLKSRSSEFDVCLYTRPSTLPTFSPQHTTRHLFATIMSGTVNTGVAILGSGIFAKEGG